MVVQTAGRDSLGDFAPQFVALNDDVLFGQVWSNEELDLKTRSIVTVTALVSKGVADESLRHHLATAKANGVTRSEIANILTRLAFYAGWPNASGAFRFAKDVWGPEDEGGHGARADSWFSHSAIAVPGENASNEWIAPVGDEEYAAL